MEKTGHKKEKRTKNPLIREEELFCENWVPAFSPVCKVLKMIKISGHQRV